MVAEQSLLYRKQHEQLHAVLSTTHLRITILPKYLSNESTCGAGALDALPPLCGSVRDRNMHNATIVAKSRARR